MIGISRKKIYRTVGLPAAALTLILTTGLGAQTAWASSSQVCGNEGTGYCLNDWGGGGNSGDAIKMYNGGTANDDFYVQEVNRCNGSYRVTYNCPFSTPALNNQYHNYPIAQITYTNNETQCVASTSNDHAVLGSCADPLNGSGGANGVIMILDFNLGCGDTVDFIDRYASDASGGIGYRLTSGGNPGAQATFTAALVTCWGGFPIFNP